REQAVSLTAARPRLPATDSVPVRTRYRQAARPCKLAFADPHSGVIRTVVVPGRFTPHLEATWRVRLPRAYAVPRNRAALLAVLLEPASKHGLARFAEMELPVAPQSAYPIWRVV